MKRISLVTRKAIVPLAIVVLALGGVTQVRGESPEAVMVKALVAEGLTPQQAERVAAKVLTSEETNSKKETKMETTPSKETPPKRFPVVPTTRILAIGRFTTPPTPEQVKEIFPHEVPATLKLYLEGKIDQMWVRQDQTGPVFLMNVTNVAEAHDILEKLPLGVAKLMDFELIELGPLTPLHLLLTPGYANGGK